MEDNNVFNIIGISRHRLSTDGHGITTLVGLKGCPLHCKYCINKEILAKQKPKCITPEKLFQETMQDYCYFIATNGGITFGGGESLLHYKPIIEFKKLLPEFVSVNVETSLNVDSIAVESSLDYIDEWIIDIKDIDSSVYESYTGITQDKLLQNLAILEEHNLQDKCTVRVPLIPDYNTVDNREKTIKWLHQHQFNKLDVFNYVVKI